MVPPPAGLTFTVSAGLPHPASAAADKVKIMLAIPITQINATQRVHSPPCAFTFIIFPSFDIDSACPCPDARFELFLRAGSVFKLTHNATLYYIASRIKN